MSRVGGTEHEIATRLLTDIGNLQKSINGEGGIEAQVKALAAKLKGLEDLNIAKVLEEFEKQRAGFEKMADRLRRASAKQLGLVGAEDEVERFSLVKTFMAIKTGDWKRAPFEKALIDEAVSKASHIADVGSRGGFFIPDFVIADVITAVYAASALINLNGIAEGQTRVTVLDGVPSLSGTIPKVKGGCVAYWVGEEDEVAESAMAVGDVTFNLKTLAVLIKITEKMQDFGGFGYEAALRTDMLRAMASKMDYSLLYSRGTDNMPRGVIGMRNVKKFSAVTRQVETSSSYSTAGRELDFDGLDEMIGILEDANFTISPAAAIIAHPKYYRRLKRIKVQHYSGQSGLLPYLLAIPRIPDAALSEIIGPFGKSTQIPVNRTAGQSAGWSATGSGQTAKFTDVFYGNWNDVVVVRGMGITVKDDEGKGKGFASGHMFVRVRTYADFVARYEESLVYCSDAQVAD